MLKGYADVHVPHAIVEALRRRGMDVVTAQEQGHHEAEDMALLAQARRGERVLLTNDQDFLRIAAGLAQRGEPFCPVFFWPQQRRSVGQVVRRIVQAASGTNYQEACSRVYFL